MAEHFSVRLENVGPQQASEFAQQFQQWVEERSADQPIRAELSRTNPNAQSGGDSVLLQILDFATHTGQHAIALTAAHFLYDMIKTFLAAKGLTLAGGHVAAAVVVKNLATGQSVEVAPEQPESAIAVEKLMEGEEN